MNSQILKLEAPYNIIYAGGRIGRHIATMTVWEDSELGIYEASQYPMIDEGGDLAAGALVTEAELCDCRVICNERDPRIGLRSLAEIVKYDFEQEEPVEFAYLWERLSLLGDTFTREEYDVLERVECPDAKQRGNLLSQWKRRGWVEHNEELKIYVKTQKYYLKHAA